jgi:MFS family permease
MSQPATPEAPGPLTAPFGAVEPNVIVAGIEAAVVIWVSRAAFAESPLFPNIEAEWHWWFVIAGIVVLLALFLLGLAVEGLADLAEHVLTRIEKLREWYKKVTNPPSNWKAGQRWMWMSPQASHEFARRRMRILVARNTWFLIFVLWVTLTVTLIVRHPPSWGWWLLLNIISCGVAFALFVYIWVRALHGWNKAVRDAGHIGKP